jgi:hypothetical protein
MIPPHIKTLPGYFYYTILCHYRGLCHSLYFSSPAENTRLGKTVGKDQSGN